MCFWTGTFFTFLFSHLRVILMTAQVTVNLVKQELLVQFEKMSLCLASCELQIGSKLWWTETVSPVRRVQTSLSLCSCVGCTELTLNVLTEAGLQTQRLLPVSQKPITESRLQTQEHHHPLYVGSKLYTDSGLFLVSFFFLCLNIKRQRHRYMRAVLHSERRAHAVKQDVTTSERSHPLPLATHTHTHRHTNTFPSISPSGENHSVMFKSLHLLSHRWQSTACMGAIYML